MIPSLEKVDLVDMKPDERNDSVVLAEKLAVEWLHSFLDEVYRIDDFVQNKQTELISAFIRRQDKFRIMTEHHGIDDSNKSYISNTNQA